MTNLVLVILCLIIGILLQRVKDMPENAPKALNTYLIYIVLPALALMHIPVSLTYSYLFCLLG